MASDSLLGKRSSDNTPSNSTKRTQSSSSSSSSQRPAVNEVDSADKREGDDSNQQVNAAESDDDTQLPQPRPLPGFFFETSRHVFADNIFSFVLCYSSSFNYYFQWLKILFFSYYDGPRGKNLGNKLRESAENGGIENLLEILNSLSANYACWLVKQLFIR